MNSDLLVLRCIPSLLCSSLTSIDFHWDDCNSLTGLTASNLVFLFLFSTLWNKPEFMSLLYALQQLPVLHRIKTEVLTMGSMTFHNWDPMTLSPCRPPQQSATCLADLSDFIFQEPPLSYSASESCLLAVPLVCQSQ